MEKFWRITKRVALGLLIVLILLIGAGFVIIRYYEDDVVGYALTKLNDRLKTKANVGSADLTFWETFPKASIRFTDVYVQETFPEKTRCFFPKRYICPST
jgi:autotransporter translocation and assembly factor TamB